MSGPAGWLSRRRAEAQIAFMTLTRLPAGRVRAPAPSMAASSWAFPLCGAVAGALAWLAWSAALAAGLPAAVAAILALAAGALLTGGLHQDGLADLADGLGGGRDRERVLAIMRDSRIGSHGVLALLLVLGLEATALAAFAPPGPGPAAFIAMAMASRALMLLPMAALPPARRDGLGRAAADPGRARVAAGLALGAAALLPLGGAALAVLAAMALATLLPALLARRRIGGQTGDVLGAVQQLAEAAGWLALLAASGTA